MNKYFAICICVWEQRKFEEFVRNVAKKNKDNLDLEPYAVTNDRGFIAQKDAHDEFGYMSNVDRTAYNIVPPKSFAYNPARINVGSLGYYEGSENVIVSSLYEVFQTEDYIDDRFLWHWLKSEHFPKWIEKLQEGSVRLYFYFDKLIQCQLMIPSYEEQHRISAYLDSIDTLITLHQCKYQNYPMKYVNDWEQRKLEDIVDVCSGRDYKHLSEGDIPVYGTGGYMLSVSEALSENDDAIGIGRKGTIDNPYILRAPFWTVDTLFYCIPKEKFNLDFVFCLYQNVNWKSMDESTGVPSLSKLLINNVEVSVPTKAEQEQIGKYFSKIDHLITLHQRKCDELQNIKKYMLQNMFV